jgi:xylan 1,4-beta-xylosidase
MVYQLKTFQGIRFSLFHFRRGSARPIPYSKSITLTNIANGKVLTLVDGKLRTMSAAPSGNSPDVAARFRVIDRARGRVALHSVVDGKLLPVAGPSEAGTIALAVGKNRNRTRPSTSNGSIWSAAAI